MNIKKVLTTYLAISIIPLISFYFFKTRKELLLGYLIGVIIALGQTSFIFIKANSIIDNNRQRSSDKILLTPSMFWPMLVITLLLVIIYRYLGIYHLIGAIIAIYLQKPALYLSFK